MTTEQEPEGRRTGARGTYAVGDDRRLRILDAAVEHFAQWGFHASSLARIAKDVGITQGGLLHHFRNKESLLVAVLERSDEQDVEKFFATGLASAAECFATLAELTAHNANRLGRVKMFNVLLAEASNAGHPAHSYFTRRHAEVLELTADTLRRAVDSGELKPGTDPRALAREVVAVMDGLQLQWALDPHGLDMPAAFRSYADRTLRATTVAGTGLPDTPDA
ncbi:TetR/AcrR family transcriptional regulator [Streptomyces sp. NPDC003038]|uniref:TetR/AcrR family transcriptional regulator n=1 Tax=unclassified Streptomyces TaxID=2593676 RepID=UPI0033A0D9AC